MTPTPSTPAVAPDAASSATTAPPGPRDSQPTTRRRVLEAPDIGRAAEVTQRVEGGPDGAAGVEDVVDEDHGPAVDPLGRQVGVLEGPGRVQPQVVAVHGHVQRADRDVGALDRGDPGRQPMGQRDLSLIHI